MDKPNQYIKHLNGWVYPYFETTQHFFYSGLGKIRETLINIIWMLDIQLWRFNYLVIISYAYYWLCKLILFNKNKYKIY